MSFFRSTRNGNVFEKIWGESTFSYYTYSHKQRTSKIGQTSKRPEKIFRVMIFQTYTVYKNIMKFDCIYLKLDFTLLFLM